MRIALFDFVVSPHTGPGGCDVDVLAAIAHDHDVTVFASEITVPDDVASAIDAVAVRTVRRPSFLAFLTYLVRVCLTAALARVLGRRHDVRQVTDCSFPSAEVCYAHLCHRAYLREVWPHLPRRRSPRMLHSWANHGIRALIEARLVASARVVVVPSEGLRRDMARIYPHCADKLRVIHNAVDLDAYAPPPGFRRDDLRAQMSTEVSDTAVVFVALGHFERKGLPQLLDAFALARDALAGTRLWVVGGEPGLLAAYRRIAEELGILEHVRFAGRAADVRPFLWSADAYVAPSHYEAFSLALLEAAAAGLPLIATRISGSEELLEDGKNGYAIEPEPESIATALARFVALDRGERATMGDAARCAVRPFGRERFATAWRELYVSLGASNVTRQQA